MPQVPLIINVAMDYKRGIARDGKIPWDIPADRKNFKRLTSPSDPKKVRILVCGPKTYATLPTSMLQDDDRLVCVVRDPARGGDFSYAHPFNTLDAVLEYADQHADAFEAVHVIGGRKLFEEAFVHPRASVAHITVVLHPFDCDLTLREVTWGWKPIGPGVQQGVTGLEYVTETWIRA